MTRFIHDKFAKDYLEELLKDYGEVKASEKVSGEIKTIRNSQFAITFVTGI
ncbi:hypothetical protein [Nostoc sp. FACHB-888]|uniref:hypothetical protein n=1 Tax=Nostoc sp. FACHB-888 TaxID=2692842 RepID=UPI001683E8D0|nr:hypothetical protein [Nostoc sp. FACHB-888]MBD2243306.1 hypothetical protein [Nostoc sp. FACHB-888]